MIPKEIKKVVQYLKNNPVQLQIGMGDARQDSANSESKIVTALVNQQINLGFIQGANVEKHHNRNWYDIKIKESNKNHI